MSENSESKLIELIEKQSIALEESNERYKLLAEKMELFINVNLNNYLAISSDLTLALEKVRNLEAIVSAIPLQYNSTIQIKLLLPGGTHIEKIGPFKFEYLQKPENTPSFNITRDSTTTVQKISVTYKVYQLSGLIKHTPLQLNGLSPLEGHSITQTHTYQIGESRGFELDCNNLVKKGPLSNCNFFKITIDILQ